MRVLVADDDGPSRYLLKAILEPQGYNILSASNGLQALEMLKDNPVDLIISDIMMPKMDGFQLLRHCKTNEKLKSVPFIVYTANYTEEKDIELARELGADLILVKPIEPEEFFQNISSLIPEIHKTGAKEPSISADERERYLEKYADRIVAKLDEKVAELQNLNRLLHAIRRINQTIVRIKDPSDLFDHACEILVNEANYKGAWIIKFNQEGSVGISKSAGFSDTIEDLISSLNSGEICGCIQKLYDNKGNVIVIDPEDYEESCPVGGHARDLQSMLAGIVVGGRIVGIIIVFLEQGQEINDDEISLFSEIADDISFAISTIKIDRERKKAEIDKIRSEEKYRQLFDNASDSIFLHEFPGEGMKKGRILEVNEAACKRLGYEHDELLDLTVFDITINLENENLKSIVNELLKKEHILFEGHHKTKDGSIYPVEVSSHMFTMEDQQVLLSICRDITERKEMEGQITTAIRQIEANLGQLAILNDEIRNPLTVIVAYAEDAPENLKEPILNQAFEIDKKIKQLDQEWLKSEKIWAFMRRYYGIEYN